MRGHDEHGDRDFRKAPRAARGAGRGEWCSSEREASAAHRSNGLPAAGADRPAGRVFRVAPEEFEHLQRRIQTLGRRARRIGVEPVRLIDTGERDASGHALVLLSGRAPVLAGWTLAAIVEHRDGRATVRPVGEQGDRLAASAFAAAICEHCGLRRRRTRTFVVVHTDSGEVRQVGSGCLRDFLGGTDPERACREAELLAAARAELDRAGTLAIAPDGTGASIEEFAAHAAHVVRIHGFTSQERARRASRPATADLALRSLRDTPAAPDGADRALADAAFRWARALLAARRDLSPFERDAVALVRGGNIQTRRDRGLVCALIAVYRQRRARSRHLAHPGAHRGDRARRARPHATLPAARHRPPLRADRRRRKPARVVADRRRPPSPRRGRDADRPGEAPHAVRRRRGHRAQPLSPAMNRIKRWRRATPDPVPGPTTPRDTSPRQMTTPLHPAEDATTTPRSSPRTGEDGRPVTEGQADGRHRPGNATSRRRNVSGSKRVSVRTETNHPGERIGAERRATVAAMPGSPAPSLVTVSVHAAERCRHRVKPGLDLHAASGELERLRAMGEISAREPAWLGAANAAPYHLLIGDAIVLPLLPHPGGWVARICGTQGTLTPRRREAKSAFRASLAARKRAQRRARS